MGQTVADQAESPQYRSPPILEAVVQIIYAEPLSDAIYRKLIKRLKRGYVNEIAVESVSAKLNFPARKAAFEGTPQTRYSSADEADILIAAHQSLTWSRLAPYESWQVLAGRVRIEVGAAMEVAGYRKAARLGVRYVNRLDVPNSDDDIVRYEDYLTINVSVPESWTAVDNYAWRIERRFGELKAIVQSAVTEPELPDTGAFLLDIDVVFEGIVPAKLEDIFIKLDEMRDLKNEIFEASITDIARASFQK